MASSIGFLNKNLFRRYPFQSSASLFSDNGLTLPDDVIAHIAVSTTQSKSNVYVKQITISGGYVSVTLEHYDSNPSNVVTLGCFTAQITEDFQEANLTSFVSYASGKITFGAANNIQSYFGVYNFSYSSSVLEPTTIFCYTPPAVSSLNTINDQIVGFATIGTLTNLSLSLSGNSFDFSVKDNSTLLSLADQSSQFSNCPTPAIFSINDAVPYSPDTTSANDNNIYIIGVDPIIFEPDTTTASLNVITPNLTLSELCVETSQVIPPISPNYLVNRSADSFTGLSSYYSKSQTPIVNTPSETIPEYSYWPYFVNTFNFSATSVTNGTLNIFSPGGSTSLIPTIKGSSGVANGTTTFTDTTANFSSSLIGQTISIVSKGSYIITAVNSTTSLTLSSTVSAATGLVYYIGNTAKVTMVGLYASTGTSFMANFAISGTPATITSTITPEGSIMIPNTSAGFNTGDSFELNISSISGSPNLNGFVLYQIGL